MNIKDVRKFIKHLEREYPLESPLEVRYTLMKSELIAEKTGKSVRGGVTISDGVAHIGVSLCYAPIYVYRTLAHEYRHVMQHASGWVDGKGSFSKEQDARLFGGRVARMYVYGSC